MMEFFYLELISIPAMLFSWFCNKVTFFKFFCLSDVGKDHNGQMRIKLNNMKFIIIINYHRKDTMVNQIIFQIINSRFSIWLLFFIQPAENLRVKSFLGQWLFLSLVHQIWVSFKMKVCCCFMTVPRYSPIPPSSLVQTMEQRMPRSKQLWFSW